MRVLIGLALLVLATFTSADPVSNHNEPHAGIQAAIDRLDAAGCTRYSITRSGQYVLNSTSDPDAFNLVGNTITVRCLSKPAPVSISHLLTWQHANRRMPHPWQTIGDPMQLSEVAGYELEHNGMVQAVGLVTNHTVDNPNAGSNRYRIATRDRIGQLGPFSNYVTLQ